MSLFTRHFVTPATLISNKVFGVMTIKTLLEIHIFVVITGIRRSGKSTVLALLNRFLLEEGIQQERIIRINFESFQSLALTDPMILYNYVKEKIISSDRCYLLLDEIQEVKYLEG